MDRETQETRVFLIKWEKNKHLIYKSYFIF